MSVARSLNPLKLGQDKGAAVTEGLATPLKSVLTCPVCNQRYDDTGRRPKFLVCFHTACQTCLNKAYKQGKVQCPTCSRPTETEAVSKLPDNTQLVTLVLNLSCLNLAEAGVAGTGKDQCTIHAARKNFWCQTCKMAVCRDCTVVGHRQAMGHKVLDHDEAVTTLRAEVRQAAQDTRNLRQETRKLRHDQRQYLTRQLEACRAFEKQLKGQLKSLSSDRKEELRQLERAETEASSCTSLTTLIETARRAGEARLAAARDFALAKKAMTDNLLAVSQLNRSSDELDVVTDGGGLGPTPGSPNLDRKGKLSTRGFRQSWHVARPALSLDVGDMSAKIRPLPKVYLDLAIEGIQQRGRIVIELRPDKAPRLCDNFARLCSGERGYGYSGCKVFRCLPGWWIQAGDFESNDGEGGRSALEDDMVEAETTDLEARPGAVEMVCVSSSDRGALMVASQFFVHVKKYSYTHVFAYVIEGLDLVERLTQLGDSDQAYYPNQEITIVDCGRIQA